MKEIKRLPTTVQIWRHYLDNFTDRKGTLDNIEIWFEIEPVEINPYKAVPGLDYKLKFTAVTVLDEGEEEYCAEGSTMHCFVTDPHRKSCFDDVEAFALLADEMNKVWETLVEHGLVGNYNEEALEKGWLTLMSGYSFWRDRNDLDFRVVLTYMDKHGKTVTDIREFASKHDFWQERLYQTIKFMHKLAHGDTAMFTADWDAPIGVTNMFDLMGLLDLYEEVEIQEQHD